MEEGLLPTLEESWSNLVIITTSMYCELLIDEKRKIDRFENIFCYVRPTIFFVFLYLQKSILNKELSQRNFDPQCL